MENKYFNVLNGRFVVYKAGHVIRDGKISGGTKYFVSNKTKIFI